MTKEKVLLEKWQAQIKKQLVAFKAAA